MSEACVRETASAIVLALTLLSVPTLAQSAPLQAGNRSVPTAPVTSDEPDQALAAFADLRATVSDVKSLYGGLSSYAKVTNLWEEKLSSRIGPSNAFGGLAVVEAHGPDAGMFVVSYTKVPRKACIRMTAKNPSDDVLKTYIGSVEGPFTVERAAELCQDETIISWVFR